MGLSKSDFKTRLLTLAQADPDRLSQHVKVLSEDLSPRDYLSIDNLNACADYISSMMVAAGGKVNEQVFTVDKREYRNVIAEFGPETKEIVVVGAHYDAHGKLPGADDNASGVAGILELGRI